MGAPTVVHSKSLASRKEGRKAVIADKHLPGFIRGWRSEYYAAGTYTELYADDTSDSGDWQSMIEDNGHFFNTSTNDDIGFLSTPWSFTCVKGYILYGNLCPLSTETHL